MSPATRTAAGRFAPGVSGNPLGRPRGARNKATLWAEALRDPEEGLVLARGLLDDAHGGDKAAKRFCIDRIEPRPRGRFVVLDVPEGDECHVTDVFDAVTRALCDGLVTPDEALAAGRYLALRQALPAAWLAEDERRAERRDEELRGRYADADHDLADGSGSPVSADSSPACGGGSDNGAGDDESESAAEDAAAPPQEPSPPLRGKDGEGRDAAPALADDGVCPEPPTPTLPGKGGGRRCAGEANGGDRHDLDAAAPPREPSPTPHPEEPPPCGGVSKGRGRDGEGGDAAAGPAPVNSLLLQAPPVSPPEDGPDRRYYPYGDLHKPRGGPTVRGFRTILVPRDDAW